MMLTNGRDLECESGIPSRGLSLLWRGNVSQGTKSPIIPSSVINTSAIMILIITTVAIVRL